MWSARDGPALLDAETEKREMRGSHRGFVVGRSSVNSHALSLYNSVVYRLNIPDKKPSQDNESHYRPMPNKRVRSSYPSRTSRDALPLFLAISHHTRCRLRWPHFYFYTPKGKVIGFEKQKLRPVTQTPPLTCPPTAS